MSLADRFGPPAARSLQSEAIAWCRSSIYSRFGRGHRYRSPLSISIMYAAELAAGDVNPKRRRKLETGRADLEAMTATEIETAKSVVRAARDAAPDPLAKDWANRALDVLSEVAVGTVGGPPADVTASLSAVTIAALEVQRRRPELERLAARRLEASSPEYVADLKRYREMPRDSEGWKELRASIQARVDADILASGDQ